MTSSSQAKGDRAEREVIAMLDDLAGIKARRTRLAGRDDHGDLSGVASTTVQVKSYRDANEGLRRGMADLAEQKERAETPWGALFLRRTGGKWVVCMTVEDFVSMHREATA